MDFYTMDKVDLTKKIVAAIITTSVSGTVVTLIHMNTPTFTKTQKVKVYIGAYVMGAMVSDKAVDYTNLKIDEIVKAWNDYKSKKEEPDLWTPTEL